MELKELKKQIEVNSIRYSRDELHSIFEIKTRHAVKSINRKMSVDAIIMGITTAVLVMITFSLGLKSAFVVSSQIVGLSVVLLLHYRIKYMLLNRHHSVQLGLYNAIKRTFVTLKIYMALYLFIVPAMVIYLSAHVFSISFLFLFMIGIISLFITLVLLKWLYGNEYFRIKKLANDTQVKF